ncbi:S-adenosyl-L-methionine-dependent methyltransferase [Mytilinidion resinicola]|uniref:RNA methyltransferase n=1 Tax=Mytilinidion resinicola TaxID=574789 RepID=A0A6A6XYR7_9PEZI|nr:S-adenosyl-L-methionine-dependent methyltransferase [Mytilinidion resinicola]KAF2801706.1 S-adenosyl-L-methionine-dependent methyltransferase [Mytilinidion resinicola]
MKDSPTESNTPVVSKERLNKANHELHRFGNYKSYYTHFRSPVSPDTRLTQLSTFITGGKRILDLGCNSGKLTLELASHFAASEVVGVDLDLFLIEQAEKAKSSEKQEAARKVTFELFDFASTIPFVGAAAEIDWDVVLLLSVIKWVHLNTSDQVLIDLFMHLFTILKSGGYLVIEPQDWTNYKRAVKKCPSLKENFKKLRLRPPFDDVLKSQGWEEVDGWERDEVGFERSVRVWRKPVEDANALVE